jgi:hypothetical protein
LNLTLLEDRKRGRRMERKDRKRSDKDTLGPIFGSPLTSVPEKA